MSPDAGCGPALSTPMAHRFSYFLVMVNTQISTFVITATTLDVLGRTTFLLEDQFANMGDAASKNRTAFGSRHGRSKLTEGQIADIRDRYIRGLGSQKELAAEFGVTQGHVSEIVRGVKWKRHAKATVSMRKLVQHNRQRLKELRRLSDSPAGSSNHPRQS